MRKKKIVLLLVLLGAASGLAQEPGRPTLGRPSEGPFWEARSYERWTREEVQEILLDSPWTQTATLVEPGVVMLPSRRKYYVQWYSAQTLREALVRLRHLQGRMDSVQDAEFLEKAPPGYQFYIFSAVQSEDGRVRTAPIGPFEGMTQEEVQQGTLLQFSAQEYRSRPDEVEFVRDTDTGRLAGIRLTFQRARQAVPPEQARRGQVQLVCPTPRGMLSASFRLGEMHRNGRPDL
ncbi:MAG: hypothetical protein V3R29_05295 [Candidatus Acidoferrales bacterium]